MTSLFEPMSIAHVCTTINPRAPYLWENLNTFERDACFSYVVLDSKEPTYDDPRFIDFKSDFSTPYEKIAPTKSYSRKNIGFLRAYLNNHDWIFETDDDNRLLIRPQDLLKCYSGEYSQINSPKISNLFSSVYETDVSSIWARGFPLNLIDSIPVISDEKYSINHFSCPVVQFLVKNEPDVDAIMRLVMGKNVTFPLLNSYEGYLLSHSYHPFNSQGTLWHKSALALAYLPSTCNFRMTDIYRGYIAQHILYSNNCKLLFSFPALEQHRNPHVIFNDFADEHSSYLRIEELINIISSVSKDTYENMLFTVYELLSSEGFFDAKVEIPQLQSYLNSLKS